MTQSDWSTLQTGCAAPNILNLESSDDGSVGTLAVSVITKYRGVFDIMNINEFSLSVPATLGAGADQLLTSDINPSVVARTFISRYSLLSSRFTGAVLVACDSE